VAVKLLQERHAHDEGIAGRFTREARLLMELRHPHVVDALGVGTLHDGRPFLVTELLEGATLGALVRAGGPLALGRALALWDQMLAGLAAVHEAGVVHRDLSPDNVFLARAENGEERLVILDFGFAQEAGVDSGDGVTPDSPGSLVGTLTFMAPEQATRGRAITARSDLFAAALLFHYAVTGKLPFRGADDLDVLVSVVRAAPIPLRRELREAPAALEAALLCALSKHPDARFSSAHEMRAALARAGETVTQEAPVSTRRVRGVRTARTRRTAEASRPAA
jgi:serine/threonine-protein kinase